MLRIWTQNEEENRRRERRMRHSVVRISKEKSRLCAVSNDDGGDRETQRGGEGQAGANNNWVNLDNES